MDNIYNKHHFFKVYFLADKEISDVNKLQNKYEYKSMFSKKGYLLFGFKIENIFESQNSAKEQVENSAKNASFEVKKFWLEKNKKDEIVY